MRPHIPALAGLAALCAVGLAACGQQPQEPGEAPPAREITRANSQAFGDHVVHFNAQSTTMLPAEVARAYGITRSDNRAMLNVALIHKDERGRGTPVPAEISVSAVNLLNQARNISLRELREGDAIYYIGEFKVSNEETLNFRIVVRPEGTNTPHEITFSQQFYTD